LITRFAAFLPLFLLLLSDSPFHSSFRRAAAALFIFFERFSR